MYLWTTSEHYLEGRCLMLELWSSWLLFISRWKTFSSKLSRCLNLCFWIWPEGLHLDRSSAVCFTPNSSHNPQNSCGLFILSDNVFETIREYSDQALQEKQCYSILSSKTWLKVVSSGNIYSSLQIKQSSRCRKSRFASPLLAEGVQNSCVSRQPPVHSQECRNLQPRNIFPSSYWRSSSRWEKSQNLLGHREK